MSILDRHQTTYIKYYLLLFKVFKNKNNLVVHETIVLINLIKLTKNEKQTLKMFKIKGKALLTIDIILLHVTIIF